MTYKTCYFEQTEMVFAGNKTFAKSLISLNSKNHTAESKNFSSKPLVWLELLVIVLD
jgi:hypothetical protein